MRVQYEDMEENSATGKVFVVMPAYIIMRIVSTSKKSESFLQTGATGNFYLIAEHQYELLLEVYDAESNKIYDIEVI